MKCKPSIINLFLFAPLICCTEINRKDETNKPLIIKYTSSNVTTIKSRTDTAEHQLSIGYFKDYILYEVPSINYEVFETSTVNKQKIVKASPKDTLFTYFINKKDAKHGVKYSELGSKEPGVFSVDSLLRSLSIHPQSFEIFEIDLGKPEKISEYENGWREAYYTKVLSNDPDSIYRYYKKELNNLPFAFSPSLDLANKAKLWRTDLIFLPRIKNGIQQRAITQVSISTGKSNENLIKIFQKFEQDMQK